MIRVVNLLNCVKFSLFERVSILQANSFTLRNNGDASLFEPCNGGRLARQ
uniref:Uncharacterized protein n=1 Tax=Rhizophora mucronata TaxID=61149 RepID=A0A2P2KMG7_RHIMU